VIAQQWHSLAGWPRMSDGRTVTLSRRSSP
jgi:hypothetical protein